MKKRTGVIAFLVLLTLTVTGKRTYDSYYRIVKEKIGPYWVNHYARLDLPKTENLEQLVQARGVTSITWREAFGNRLYQYHLWRPKKGWTEWEQDESLLRKLETR